MTHKDTFARAEALLGTDSMKRLENIQILLFGVGGVGSWAAEGLVRSGVKHLTIVDPDLVDPTNINRQLMATSLTIGQPKVEALKKHLLEINPDAEIIALQERYSASTEFGQNITRDFDRFDYIIDAIDSMDDKVELIIEASKSKATLISSMGAAMKTDPTKVSVAEFWKVKGCPLARALRNKMKRSGRFPEKKFLCVYSEESRPELADSSLKGSIVQVTATFGFTLCSLIV